MANHQWAVVTGASSGVGQCFAKTLAARGANVLAVARRKDRLDQLAKTAAAGGAKIEPFLADLSSGEGVSAVMRRISELHDVEMLVNCAGVATAGDFLDSSLEAELASIRVNVESVVSLTREVLPHMVQRRRGQILNVASVVGFQPFPHFATYAATKAFVLSFTEAIAEEVRGTPTRRKVRIYHPRDTSAIKLVKWQGSFSDGAQIRGLTRRLALPKQ